MGDHLANYFADLDQDFIGIGSDLSDEVFVFNGKGVNVQSSYELPLPVVLPGSEVIYAFSTEAGPISFGVLFLLPKETNEAGEVINPDEEPKAELIVTMERMESHTRLYEGKFQAPNRFGTLYMVWDNSHAWLPNQLSYSITMTQATFSLIDEARSRKAAESLERARRTHRRQRRKLKHLHSYYEHEVHPQVVRLQEEMGELQRQLQSHNETLRLTSRQCAQLSTQLDAHHVIQLGLIVRSLDHQLLRRVLSFLLPVEGDGDGRHHESVQDVCKYWHFAATVAPDCGARQVFESALESRLNASHTPPSSTSRPALAREATSSSSVTATTATSVRDGVSAMSLSVHEQDSDALYVPFPTKPWGRPRGGSAVSGSTGAGPGGLVLGGAAAAAGAGGGGGGGGGGHAAHSSGSSRGRGSGSRVPKHGDASEYQQTGRSLLSDEGYPILSGDAADDTSDGSQSGSRGWETSHSVTSASLSSANPTREKPLPISQPISLQGGATAAQAPSFRFIPVHSTESMGMGAVVTRPASPPVSAAVSPSVSPARTRLLSPSQSPSHIAGQGYSSQSQTESNSASASASATGQSDASTASKRAHVRVAEERERERHRDRARQIKEPDARQSRDGASTPSIRAGVKESARDHPSSSQGHGGAHSRRRTPSSEQVVQRLEKKSKKAKSVSNMRVAMRARIRRQLAEEKELLQRRVDRVDELMRKRTVLKAHIDQLETEFEARYGRAASDRELRHYAADTFDDLDATQARLKKEEREVYVLLQHYKDTKAVYANLSGI